MGTAPELVGSGKASSHIKGFDGLRAISIILVILTHMSVLDYLPDTAFFQGRFHPLVSGVTGVNIFFTLSGFLITRILIREQARTGKINLRSFYARRFLRLTPPFILFLVLLLIGTAFGVYTVYPIGLLLSFAYLYNFIPHFLLNGQLSHTWSLAVEEQFYLVWPFLITLLPHRRLAFAALAAVALAVLAAYVLPGLSFPHNGHVYTLQDTFFVSRWFFPAAGPIMVGAFMAVLLFKRPAACRHLALSSLAFPLSAALFLSPLYLPVALLPMAFVIQAAGVAVLLLAIMERQEGALTRLLEFRPLAYLGKISYGVYLYHVLATSTGAAGATVKSAPLSILLFMGLAIASYELYEKPILKLKARFQ
ncbi:MAG: acyltransferase [Flavobacteriales bacterium]|nr:acyltransferase [Flavobacteriales bacterium]